MGETTAGSSEDALADSENCAVPAEKTHADVQRRRHRQARRLFPRYSTRTQPRKIAPSLDGFGVGIRVSLRTVPVISVYALYASGNAAASNATISSYRSKSQTIGPSANRMRRQQASWIGGQPGPLTLKRENIAEPIKVALNRAHVVPETVSLSPRR